MLVDLIEAIVCSSNRRFTASAIACAILKHDLQELLKNQPAAR
jgi:hypothetical protein